MQNHEILTVKKFVSSQKLVGKPQNTLDSITSIIVIFFTQLGTWQVKGPPETDHQQKNLK